MSIFPFSQDILGIYGFYFSFNIQKIVFILFLIIVELQLSHVFPRCSPLPRPPHPLQSIPTPLSMPMSPLFMFLDLLAPSPSPSFPVIPLPSDRCQFVLYSRFWFCFARLFLLLIKLQSLFSESSGCEPWLWNQLKRNQLKYMPIPSPQTSGFLIELF